MSTVCCLSNSAACAIATKPGVDASPRPDRTISSCSGSSASIEGTSLTRSGRGVLSSSKSKASASFASGGSAVTATSYFSAGSPSFFFAARRNVDAPRDDTDEDEADNQADDRANWVGAGAFRRDC